MEAKEYLKQIGIEDRVLNREDLSEYWKSISQLMEEYAALRQPPVIGQLEAIRKDFCLWYYAQSQPLDAHKVVDWFAFNLR